MHLHHHHPNHEGNNAEDVKNVKVAFFLNLSFAIIEFVGGWLTNSVAILSDAVHDLGDSISLGIAWYFQKISKRPRTKDYTYGYKRFSLMGAVLNSVILLVGSVLILMNAIPRLFNPQQPHVQGMLLLGVLGVLVNGAAALRLRKGSSLNEKAVSLHLLEDVLGWAAVLLGAGIMHFVDAPFIDPLLSIGISLFILFNVYKNIRQSLRIILQGSPEMVKVDELEKSILATPAVGSIHDLHVWSVDGEYNILTVHVVLTQALRPEQEQTLKDELRGKMSRLGVQHVTIELEAEGADCGVDCG